MTAPTPNPGAPITRQATAREFLAVVFRRKWLILGLFAVTTATVLGIALSTETMYQSAARVLVRRGERESVLNASRRIVSDWEQELGSEIEIVKSWPVLQRARALLLAEAGADAPKLDAGSVDVEVLGKSNVVALGYLDRDPEVAQRVCDAVMRSYIEYRQRAELDYPAQFFTTEIEDARSQLRFWTEARRRYADSLGVVDVSEQKRQDIGRLSLLIDRRSELRADLAEAQTQQRLMRRMHENPGVDLPTLGEQFTNETALVELKRRIVEQEARLASVKERYRDDAAEVQSVLATIESLRALLRREVDARLEMSRSKIDIVQSRLAVVEADIRRVEGGLSHMPDHETAIAQMDRQIDVLQERVSDLTEKSDLAKVTRETTPKVTVTVLSPAGPARPINARDWVRLALAPAFSLVIGIGLAFFIDGLDLTVRTAGHAEEETDLPVLASLTERRL